MSESTDQKKTGRVIVATYWLLPERTNNSGQEKIGYHRVSSAIEAIRSCGREVVCVGYGGDGETFSGDTPSPVRSPLTSPYRSISPVYPIPRSDSNLSNTSASSGIFVDDTREPLPPPSVGKHGALNIPVQLPADVAHVHFYDFCKGVLWPLFHYQGSAQHDYNPESWRAYQTVNRLFAETIAAVYEDGDQILVQDYHLLLVPAMLRERLPQAVIGFFLHIPWPSSELYRSLPVRDQVLWGLLGADFIGFQTFPYSRHFYSACIRLLGVPTTDRGIVCPNGRFVCVDVIPMGIDPESCLGALQSSICKERMFELKKAFEGKKVIVSRARADRFKGLPHRLKAFQTFLTMFPEYVGKVVLVFEVIYVHDRSGPHAANVKQLTEEVETLIGSINGKFSTINYVPIQYINKVLPWEETCAMFAIADLCLATPLREGMNLTSYEYIACQQENMSPLVLSEFAGAAQCLSGAFLVNPYNEKKYAKAMHAALSLSDSDKKIRYKHNFDYVTTHTALYWIQHVLQEMESSKMGEQIPSSDIPKAGFDQIVKAFQQSRRRLLLFDYDGTLTPLVKTPSEAVPSKQLLFLLESLSKDEKSNVYIITGRDRTFMEDWLGNLNVGMSCEHGAFFRPAQQRDEKPGWQDITQELDLTWKNDIKAIFDDYADRTPGSMVEEKEINLTWHYRNSDPEFGEKQKNDLVLHLKDLNKLPIDILMGKKAVEVRPQGINKGSSVKKILAKELDVDFILCIGDDKTDEDMFEEVKKHHVPHCYTIIVEKKPTSAAFYVENQRSVMALLQRLVQPS